MCFSASASFGAGAVLCATGLITLKKVQSPNQFLFASMPLLFSVQQFSEAFVWLSLTNKEYETLKYPAIYTFLFFAQVVWPVFVPLALYLLEKNILYKKLQLILTAIGGALSLYLAFCLLMYPVNAVIIDRHVDYHLNFPLAFSNYSGIFYFIPTVVPALIFRCKKMQLLGITILASYVITKLFFSNYLISIWCFFAAIISILALYIIVDMNKVNDKKIKRLSFLRPL